MNNLGKPQTLHKTKEDHYLGEVGSQSLAIVEVPIIRRARAQLLAGVGTAVIQVDRLVLLSSVNDDGAAAAAAAESRPG